MMRRWSTWLLLLISPLPMACGQIIGPAQGAPEPTYAPLTVTVGSEAGTYYAFFKQISQACSAPPLLYNPSKNPGSIENLDRLLGNETNLAFVQVDALFAKKLIDGDTEVDRVRTFMVLYPEEVHVITRSDNRFIGTFGDLGNKRIGTYGGGLITTKVLFSKSSFRPAAIVTYKSSSEAVKGLERKEVDAVVGVGGQPLSWVKELDSTYRLVPFEPLVVGAVSDVYQPATISYSNLASGGTKTVSVLSLIATIDYKTPALRQSIAKLRGCIGNNLKALQETVGMHPKWRLVSMSSKGPWPYFEVTK